MAALFLLFIVLNNAYFSTSAWDLDNNDGSSNDLVVQPISLNDWGSSYYGKPVCTNIPLNMTLCNNINYKQMKIPNLLGHETLEEVEYHSSVWIPLISIKCHSDTQLFLCSLFAPICLDQMIYPCRSLCEKVRQGCEAQMNAHSYSWPPMFDCNKFPIDNGLCIQPESSMDMKLLSTEVNLAANSPVTTIKPFTKSPVFTTVKNQKTTKTNYQRKNQTRLQTNKLNKKVHVPIQPCLGCTEKDNMDNILEKFCEADIVLKGGIQTFDISNLRPLNRGKRKNVHASKYITISKQGRRILKGRNVILQNNVYITGNGQQQKYRRQVDILLLTQNYLNVAKSNRRMLVRNPKNRRFEQNQQFEYCRCKKIKQNLYDKNTKFLIMAKSAKARNFYYDRSSFNNKLSVKNFQNSIKANRNLQEQQHKLINNRSKMFYLSYVTTWQKAQKLVNFIDRNFDAELLCKNKTIRLL